MPDTADQTSGDRYNAQSGQVQAQPVQPVVEKQETALDWNDDSSTDKLINPAFFPEWFHGSLSKAAAADRLQAGGDLRNGDFLVRNRPKKPGDYVLTLVFKEIVTNHLIARDSEGVFVINKRRFDAPTDLIDLIEILQLPRADWPQRLVRHAPRPQQKDNNVVARPVPR